MGISDVFGSVFIHQIFFADAWRLNLKQDKKGNSPSALVVKKYVSEPGPVLCQKFCTYFGLKTQPICATATLRSAHPPSPTQILQIPKFPKLEFKLQTSIVTIYIIYSPLVTENFVPKTKKKRTYIITVCLPVFHYTPFATIPNGYGDYHSNPTKVVHSRVPMFS